MNNAECIAARTRTNMERSLSRQAPMTASVVSPACSAEARSAGPFFTSLLVDATANPVPSRSSLEAISQTHQCSPCNPRLQSDRPRTPSVLSVQSVL